MSQELMNSLMEILDSAHTQQYRLNEQMESLHELREQVSLSAEQSRKQLQQHFSTLRAVLCEALDQRLAALLEQVQMVEQAALNPLQECELMIQEQISNATKVLDEGKLIFKGEPENNLDKIIKLKDNPITKSLASLPEIPQRSDVACIMVETASSCHDDMLAKLRQEAKVISRAPVHITDIVERPGALLIKWAEVEDEECEVTEFCLQYSYGNVKSNSDSKASFHTAYTGPDTSFIVRQLRTQTAYSFRLRGRPDSDSAWSVWTVPTVSATSIPHFQWQANNASYSTSNENKTATRCGEGLTSVLYSDCPSLEPGLAAHFRVLDCGERSPGDGIGLAARADNSDTLIRPGAVFVDINGVVYVDGQELKTRLPALGKGSSITFDTEPLPNGKIRVSVQVQDKEVTSDWKPEATEGLTSLPQAVMGMGLPMQRQQSCVQQLYFALKFAHEDWKVGVE